MILKITPNISMISNTNIKTTAEISTFCFSGTCLCLYVFVCGKKNNPQSLPVGLP